MKNDNRIMLLRHKERKDTSLTRVVLEFNTLQEIISSKLFKMSYI